MNLRARVGRSADNLRDRVAALRDELAEEGFVVNPDGGLEVLAPQNDPRVRPSFLPPFEERSLPPRSEDSPLSEFEVVESLPVLSGETAPFFDQPGGGTQFFLGENEDGTPISVAQLLEDGLIRRVN